jgi:hypothetical protein
MVLKIQICLNHKVLLRIMKIDEVHVLFHLDLMVIHHQNQSLLVSIILIFNCTTLVIVLNIILNSRIKCQFLFQYPVPASDTTYYCKVYRAPKNITQRKHAIAVRNYLITIQIYSNYLMIVYFFSIRQ